MNESINEEKKENKVVVMDFMADWCGPCKLQDPIIEELKKKYGNKVEFKKINIDNDSRLAEKYLIRAVPTLIIEKNGDIFRKHVGVAYATVLGKYIEDALR